MRTLFLFAFLIGAAPMYAAQTIELVAGGGPTATGGDGSPATQVKLNGPFGVDFDKAGNMYFVEMYGNRLCKVDSQGVLHVLCGDGEKGDSGDGGPAKAARLN